MKTFIEETPMHIKNVNPRKEGGGDGGGVLASDLSVAFQVKREFMDALIPRQNGERFSDIFYGDDGALREVKIVPINYSGTIEGVRVNVFVGRKPLVFDDAKVKDIAMTPDSGPYIDVTAKIQVRPSELESGKLDALAKTVVNVSVEKMIDQGDVESAGPEASDSE